MVVTTQSTLAFQLLAQKMNVLHGRDGDFSTLTTTDKANLVAAINEIHALTIAAVGIDDTTASTTSVYSSAKTAQEIALAITNALEGEDLSDLAASITALAQADMGLVSAAAAQTFDAVGQELARANIAAAAQADLDAANALISTNAGNISGNTAAHVANAAAHAANATATAANATAVAANTAGITANANGITTLNADIGDVSTYDPVASVNAILTF